MILADTSAWIEYDRATGDPTHERLQDLIASNGPVAVTEPVVMELVAGARNERRERELRRLLARFALLRFDPASDFDGAVRVYRECRAAGVTPRGMIDCMIAAVAWRYDTSVLARDLDFARVAAVVGLRLDAASLSIPPERSTE